MSFETDLRDIDGIIDQMSNDLEKLNQELENLLAKYPRYMELNLKKLELELHHYQNAQ